jgi:ArsR family transcriptional regulator
MVERAVDAFAALAHAHRLAVFRMLLREGPEGLAAGTIAERLDVPASSLSFHLAQLERAGLAKVTRKGRHLFYALDVEGTRQLVAFLTRDCCGGRPELCGYPAATCHEAATAETLGST